jgi:hypothetical protein
MAARLLVRRTEAKQAIGRPCGLPMDPPAFSKSPKPWPTWLTGPGVGVCDGAGGTGRALATRRGHAATGVHHWDAQVDPRRRAPGRTIRGGLGACGRVRAGMHRCARGRRYSDVTRDKSFIRSALRAGVFPQRIWAQSEPATQGPAGRTADLVRNSRHVTAIQHEVPWAV